MTIDTPLGVVSGLTTVLTFRGGLGPYMIQVLPATSPSDFPLATYTTFDSPYTWQVVDIPAGINVFLRLRDVTGRAALTASFAIQPGPSGGSTTTESSTLPTSTSATLASSSTLSQNSTSSSSIYSIVTPVLSLSSSGTSPSSSATSNSNPNSFKPKPNTAVIVGATVGGLMGFLLLILIVSSFRRRMRRRRLDNQVTDMVLQPAFAPLVPPGASGTRFDSYNTISTASSITPGEMHKPTPGGFATYYGPLPVEHETRPSTASFLSTSISPPPPTYDDQAYMESVAIPTHLASNFASDSDPRASTSGVTDVIGQYATANRDLISPSLESKLRAARYHPMDNPAEISASEWQSHYQVGVLELRRLQEAYDRSRGLGNKEKAVHSAGQASPSWRPS
ncbi:SubName: Full=Uncharacterized protein {ECO:0000313/EMBL:CCA69855.1} [Serendipita indica DSM 11827]|nr:SubName: Full=Uncharacterized protein {ECO:0000313/EMBL:CCA69855.1} [Serendipita indica DSM 11827]